MYRETPFQRCRRRQWSDLPLWRRFLAWLTGDDGYQWAVVADLGDDYKIVGPLRYRDMRREVARGWPKGVWAYAARWGSPWPPRVRKVDGFWRVVR